MQQKEYTCPMHPQVRQNKPGSCPYCGMALELTVGTEEAPELANFRRRFWISLILTLPILFTPPMYQAILATPVVLWGGFPLFVKGLRTRQINMFTLISIGVGAAYFYSLWAFFYGQALYFEVAAAIVSLVLLGQYLELKARQKTGDAIASLLKLKPTTASLENGETIPLENVGCEAQWNGKST